MSDHQIRALSRQFIRLSSADFDNSAFRPLVVFVYKFPLLRHFVLIHDVASLSALRILVHADVGSFGKLWTTNFSTL
jgi:hypothetical protein